MKYGIQILPDPVIMGQTQTEEVMLVSNKFKQMYECRLPAQAVRFHQDSSSETETDTYSGPDVPVLLQPMQDAPCLLKTKDWWTYEFCNGKHIKQYHIEDTEVKGEVLFLGYYESDFDWTNETAKASKQHKLKRYHSQTYVNGSKCDLNGGPRTAEVRFVCEEASSDFLFRVDEPQSCRYVLTVHTSRTCLHPQLRPPSAKLQPIVCRAALSPQQYEDYTRLSDTKQRVEQISEELKSLDQILGRDHEDTEGTRNTPESTEDETLAQYDSMEASPEEEDADFWAGVTKKKMSPKSQENKDKEINEVIEDGDEVEQFNFKIISDPADLMKFVQHLKESNKKKAQKQLERQNNVVEEEPDEDEQVLQEFKEEMSDLTVSKDQRDGIKEEMKKEFDNIIDEAQEELETEGLKGEFERSQATQALETTLDKLLHHLEEKEEPEQESAPGSAPRGSDPTRGSPSLAPKHPDQAAEDQVKIKITKYKAGSRPGDGPLRVQELAEADPQWRHIKDVVKEQLEKAGLKAEGKIEVKILTRKNTDDTDGDQWLTEEDTKSFRELLINLLTGGTEEVYREQKRLQELEENYRFVWGQTQDEGQTSSDSEDVDL
uniref:Endoplasmic reticulum lectin n=1 Tax=Knipowitschia caucasica TaxID=637954 RepID=A0AAV2M6D6_KNICA